MISTRKSVDKGRFPFTKKIRKFRFGFKWNTTFWFVPLEILRNKRNFSKGSPVFPVETSEWKFVFHLQIFRL